MAFRGSWWLLNLLVFWILLTTANLFAQKTDTTLTSTTISQIKITRLNVFSEITGKPEFIYKLANRFHVRTRESVIRRELLFHKGSAYDAELVAESERRLRRLAFLGDAKLDTLRTSQDSLAIAVTTEDQWTTLLRGIFSQAPGRTVYGVAVEEYNLLGFGKRIYAEASHERHEGTTFSLTYDDPQLLSSVWTAEAQLVSGPFDETLATQLLRPFYSPDSKWAGGLVFTLSDRTVREFTGGIEENRFLSNTDALEVFTDHAFGARFRKTRLRLAYRFRNNDYVAVPDRTLRMPEDELTHRLSLRLQRENLSFVQEKRLDRFVRTEDLTLGAMTSVTIGRTGLPVPRGEKRFELALSRRQAWQLSGRQYLVSRLGFQTLLEKDTFANLTLRYYNRALPAQTLALNLEADLSWNSRIATPFLLGGDNGLRGFPSREFSGTRRLLINIEDRVFTPVTILTVALGGVVFFDAGHVWKDSETFMLSDLNYSAGLGLRLGYTKSPNSRVGRIDFGWALNRGGAFALTIGIDQQFSLN